MLADVTAQPVPNRASASPLMIWLTRSVVVMKAWMAASAPPASMAAMIPAAGLRVSMANEKIRRQPPRASSLYAEVEHPRSLAEDLPQGGVKKRRSGAHGRGQKGDEGTHLHFSAPP